MALPLQAETSKIMVKETSRKLNLFLIILILQALLYRTKATPIQKQAYAPSRRRAKPAEVPMRSLANPTID
jgi:hypothetical protein